jgi:hypothetical protein
MNSGEFNWVPQNNFSATIPWSLPAESALPTPQTRKRRRNNTNMNLNNARNNNTRNGMNLNVPGPKTRKSIRFANTEGQNLTKPSNGYRMRSVVYALNGARTRKNLNEYVPTIKAAINAMHSRKKANSYANNTEYLNNAGWNRFINILVEHKGSNRYAAVRNANVSNATKNRMLEYLSNIQEFKNRSRK